MKLGSAPQPIRRPLRFLAVGAAAALLMVLTASSATASDTKTLVARKVCTVPTVTVAPPDAGGYCLFTESNRKVLRGAKAYYTNPVIAAGALSSPITLRAADRRGSTATGSCTYRFPTATTPGHGLCVYTGGTGRLEGFHATLVIGPPSLTGCSVIGRYWFSEDEGDNGDD